MKHQPTISMIEHAYTKEASAALTDSILSHWPNALQPTFTSQDQFQSDVVLAIAEDENQLLEILPSIIELGGLNIPTVLICSELGSLAEMIHSIEMVHIDHDATPEVIAGVLFGVLQRNDQVSNLQGQVGLVQRMHNSLQTHLEQIQDELETAAVVQREFMSNTVESVHGVTFSTLWRPAGVVSGDMYDITQLDETHVSFFLIDAIGHDVSAAMLSMMLTRILAANRMNQQTGAFTAPKDILKMLNTALLQRNGEHARFATAAYGILNCETNELIFAGGGHPPALLSHENREPRLLNSDGPLLGVFNDAKFNQSSIELIPGNTLLVYSDGFEQALWNTGVENPTLPSHVQAMQTFCHRENEDALQAITAYLNHASVAKTDDDLTMICLDVESVQSNLHAAA